MIYVDNRSFDPAYSFACEVYYMEKLRQPFFMLWRTDPAVIIGRYQNVYKEADLPYIKENGIMVRRRYSGGGAVYADGGSLKYSVFIPGGSSAADFRRDASSFVTAMNTLGVNAVFTDRNDIYIGDRKCAGNARFSNAYGTMHHLTVLFDTDLSMLGKVLSDRTEKIRDKAIDSHRSHVCNVSEHLISKMTTEQFKDHILKNIFDGEYEYRAITPEEDPELERIADSIFRSEDHIYGKNPAFDLSAAKRFEGGTLRIGLTVEKSVIKAVGITGDFFTHGDVSALERDLIGARLDPDPVKKILISHDIFYGITPSDILSLIFT